MTDQIDQKQDGEDGEKRLLKVRPGRLVMKKTVDAGQVRQSFSHGRTKSVAVEVKRKRTFTQDVGGVMKEVSHAAQPAAEEQPKAAAALAQPAAADDEAARRPAVLRTLTDEEAAARARALKVSRTDQTSKVLEQTAQGAAARRDAQREEDDAQHRQEEEASRRQEEETRRREDEVRRHRTEEETARKAAEQADRLEKRLATQDTVTPLRARRDGTGDAAKDGEAKRRAAARPEPRRPAAARRGEPRRRTAGKLTVAQALDDRERTRSLASVRRARERDRRLQTQPQEAIKVIRDVVLPETITVQELANRMAERGVDVVKALMKMGVMATQQQTIDADTAELVIGEFGHRMRRVSEADVEIGLTSEEDAAETLLPRPPVVTVMGHVDHAKAAAAPIIVAINKIDRADADPARVRNELLQHEIVLEEFGGDILSVEVSATEKTNLDKLEEAILLQSEVLELKANPDRIAEGVVVEANLETGRGAVATVLIQRGTLNVGDIVVAGAEWGRVRAMTDYAGQKLDHAAPAMPVEIMGLSGAPMAGDEVVVVDTEARAREVTEFRQRQQRLHKATASQRGTLEQMFLEIESGETQELPIVLKADTNGTVEAISASLDKMATDEVKVRILHSGVGGINESDVTLAQASNALIIGFNVRANAQARDLAKRENADIRYYSIIYNLTDDMRDMLTGMLAPEERESFLGNAEILEVFNVSKMGKVAGCRVTEGLVRRGSSVRLLRDDVVIHEGKLATLRRFKDDVRDVRDGMECGMSFENYQDLKQGDVIECFDVEQIARTL